MFRWIIGTSLQYRVLVLAVAVALVLFGAFQLRKMPVDVLPEFAAPIVEVQTEALGLSAAEVESLITLNLEELLSGVPWLESIRGTSVTGLSSIVLTFKRGTDIMRARQLIQERLTLAYTLPNVAHPPVILQPVSATSRFMMIGLSSKTVEPTQLSLLARWTVKPKLVGVPGVANVAIWGQRLRQMHVQFDPERLRNARVTQDDLIAAAGDALWVSPLTFLKGSAPGSGGWVDNANQRFGVHHKMPIAAPEDMAKVPLGTQSLVMTGRSMALGEVAEVTFDHPPLVGDALVNGSNGLILVVEKLPGANTLEVTRGVEKALAELKHGLPGVEIDPTVFRLSSYIEESMDNLVWTIALGALLAIIVFGALLYSWRAALVSIVAIPLSLLAALAVLYVMGATLNAMVLAGLLVALGVIIDDAVVDVDAVLKRFETRESQSVFGIIRETTLNTRAATLYAALIAILSVVPVFFLGGISGAFFQPFALAYVLAVAASMLVALTVTPALGLMLLRKNTHSPVAHWLQTRSERAVSGALARPARVFVAAGLVAVVAFAAAPFLGQSLLPALQERDLVVNIATAPGTSHIETQRIATRMVNELRALDGVRNVGAHVGRAITGDQVVGINAGQIWVSVDRKANYRKTVEAVRETVEGYPGIERNVQTYLRDKVGEVLTGTADAIVVRLYGHDRGVLIDKAEEVRKALADIPGIIDLRAEGQVVEPQIRVKVDLDKAGRAAVRPGDVRRTSATIFSGLTVGFLFEDQKIYDVVVWGAPEARKSLHDLTDLWVEKPDRSHVRLSDVADVSIVPVPTALRHEKIAPYVDVLANVAPGRDLHKVVDQVEDRLERVQFPLEHHPRILGEYAERMEAQNRVLGIGLAALVGIFLLLQAALRSWRLAAIAFLALPASLAGALIAAALGGGVISLGSIVGTFAVLGIAARAAVLQLNHYRALEAAGVPFGLDLVLRGTRERLAATLASTLAIVAALLPIVAFGRIPGLEILQPTAIVIVGGLVASTLLTLFVLPALYLVFGARADHDDLVLEQA